MGSTTSDAVKKEYIDALVHVRVSDLPSECSCLPQPPQVQEVDNFTPLVEVFLKGMLESFAYIRNNCLIMDPKDESYKHSGRNGEDEALPHP